MKKFFKVVLVTFIIIIIIPIALLRGCGVYTEMRLKSFCKDIKIGTPIAEFKRNVESSGYNLIELKSDNYLINESALRVTYGTWYCDVNFYKELVKNRQFTNNDDIFDNF